MLEAEPVGQPWLGWTPRRWQAEALPVALDAIERGVAGVIRAATGSGKSLVQAELVAELLEGLAPDERIVVTVPTQKLVRQLAATIEERVPGAVGQYYQYAKQIERQVIITCHPSTYHGWVECPECTRREAGAFVREIQGEELEVARRVWVESQAAGVDLEHACAAPLSHQGAIRVLAEGRLAWDLLRAGLRVKVWIADECHQTECDLLHNWARWARPERVLGFTATPWRSSEYESLTLFDELIYDYGPSCAMQDGVVVIPETRTYGGHLEECDEICVEMIQQVLAERPGAPGVVSAVTCDDADRFAEVLDQEGIRAAAIHSKIGGRDEQTERLDQLERGELDCLVHVNMLAEGVDFPWLQWLCLRRPTSSRVRFCQEVGRVVRTHPGKDGAVVLDPHDLFGSLGLDYEAVLGGELAEESGEVDQLAEEFARELAEEFGLDPDEPADLRRGIRRPPVVDAMRSWLRRTALRLRCAGYAELKVASTHWRAHSISERQAQTVERTIRRRGLIEAAGQLHESQRVLLRASIVATRAEALLKGDVSDLLTILFVLLEQGCLPMDSEESGEVAHEAA